MSDDSRIAQTLQDWSDVFLRQSVREFKQLMDGNGLSPSQIFTLFRLYHSGPYSVSAIGSQLGVSNAASSQLIDRLVHQGMIERAEDPSDRRARNLTITSKGKALVEQGITARRQWMEGLTTELTPEQQAIVIAALIMLTKCASKISEK